jgi:RHS repeat-associated protein
MNNNYSKGTIGHEHYDPFNLIDMNGRVYDPIIGRFLSPDPVIQAPDFTQNYNSYSYCYNNPLKYYDPSGLNAVSDFVSKMVKKGYNHWNSESGYCNYSIYESIINATNYFNYFGWERLFSYLGINDENESQEGHGGPSVNNGYTQKDYFYNLIANTINYLPPIVLGPGKPTLTFGQSFINSNWYGVEIVAQVYGKMYDHYNWVQTVNFSSDFPEQQWDPHSFVNDGFYYETDLNSLSYKGTKTAYQKADADGFFEDLPSSTYFSAELTLCGYRNNRWEQIADFSWGYTINNNKANVFFYRINHPSEFHQFFTNWATMYPLNY